MIKVTAEHFIKAEFLNDVLPLYRELVAKTKQEKSCVEYQLCVDQDDPTHFIFIEQWPDREALSEHCNTEHFTRLVPAINKLQAKPAILTVLDFFV